MFPPKFWFWGWYSPIKWFAWDKMNFCWREKLIRTLYIECISSYCFDALSSKIDIKQKTQNYTNMKAKLSLLIWKYCGAEVSRCPYFIHFPFYGNCQCICLKCGYVILSYPRWFWTPQKIMVRGSVWNVWTFERFKHAMNVLHYPKCRLPSAFIKQYFLQ